MNISPCGHKSGQMLQAVRQSGCQRLFMRGFRFRSIFYSERCAYICLAPSQNSTVWPMFDGQKHSCLNPLWTYFLVTSPRLGVNYAVSQLPGVRGCHQKRQLSFLYNVFILMLAKTPISNFRRVGTAFSGELPQARTVLLFGSYSGQIFPRRNLLTRRRK